MDIRVSSRDPRQQTSWPNVDPVGSTLGQRGPGVSCYLGCYGAQHFVSLWSFASWKVLGTVLSKAITRSKSDVITAPHGLSKRKENYEVLLTTLMSSKSCYSISVVRLENYSQCLRVVVFLVVWYCPSLSVSVKLLHWQRETMLLLGCQSSNPGEYWWLNHTLNGEQSIKLDQTKLQNCVHSLLDTLYLEMRCMQRYILYSTL